MKYIDKDKEHIMSIAFHVMVCRPSPARFGPHEVAKRVLAAATDVEATAAHQPVVNKPVV